MVNRRTDERAGTEFDRVFCGLLPRLYRRARTLAGESEAEDMVHETYLKLSAGPHRLVTHPEPYAYAFSALISVLRDGLRRERGRATVGWTGDETAVRTDGGLRRREAELEAVRLLSKVSKRQAAAVLLVDLNGYTIDEAADLLGVHRGTVSRARSRALTLLHAAVETSGD